MSEFAVRNMAVLSYAQGFTSWHYRHRGPLTETLAGGFFNSFSDMAARGDMIMISGENGGAHVYVTAASEKDGVVVSVMSRTAP